MSIVDILQKNYERFLVQEQPNEIVEFQKKEAKALVERETLLRFHDQNKAVARQQLEQHKSELDVVDFVRKNAAENDVSVEQYLDMLPTDFRQAYKGAISKIGELLKLLEPQEYDLLVLPITATVHREEANIYLPVLWEEKQEGIGGVLYTKTLMLATGAVQGLDARLVEPAGYNGIVRATISGADAAAAVKQSLTGLLANPAREMEAANVSIKPQLIRFAGSVAEIVEIKEPPAQRKELPVPPGQAYTPKEAALIWREHEVEQGTVNGDEANYIMKMGGRISEGRVRTEADGRVSGQSLDDYIRLRDARNMLDTLRQQKVKTISFDDCADLLYTDRDSVLEYVQEKKVLVKGHEQVSVHSVLKFTSDHVIRDGEWVPFDSSRISRPRQKTTQIVKARSNYLTSEEAAEKYNTSRTALRKLARDGTLHLYHEESRGKFLFDKWELTEHFSGNGNRDRA